jgi:tRNA nucleotidyltransferase (CCA-adding enzyme)
MSQAGAAVDDVVTVAVAEGWGAELRDAVERVRSSGAPLTIADLAVTGNDLIAAGVPEGPEIGARLRNLLDAVLEDPAKNTKEELLGMVKGGEA